MDNSSNTPNPATTRRDTLKSAIKATLREMMIDAAEGRVINTANILTGDNVRLAFIDFLLNSPWIKEPGTNVTAGEVKEPDASVDRLLDQVDTEK